MYRCNATSGIIFQNSKRYVLEWEVSFTGFVSLMVLNYLYENQHIYLGLKEVAVDKKNKKNETKLI